MRVTPELLIIRKVNDLIKKYHSKGNVPIEEMEELKKDLDDMIKQEVGFSKLYIHSASQYVDIDTEPTDS